MTVVYCIAAIVAAALVSGVVGWLLGVAYCDPEHMPPQPKGESPPIY